MVIEPWDEQGICKFTYGQGDGKRKPKPEFFDKEGEPLDPEVRRLIHSLTKVSLIVEQKPYSIHGNIGTTLRVLGVQVQEIVTNENASTDHTLSDPGGLTKANLGAMFKAALSAAIKRAS